MDKKTAVVMATYNGMKYLEEQLDSLRFQTLKPDEVIICDDASSDGTYEFLCSYVDRYHLKQWQVVKNAVNQGWIRNFYHLFDLATAEIIFCADQDDLWLPDKIEFMTAIMGSDPEIKVLGGNYVEFTVDEKKAIKNAKTQNEIKKIKWNHKFYLTHRPGCAICFRRELLGHVNNLKRDYYPHDRLLWNLACVFDGAYTVDKDVILQRRHAASAMIIKKRQNKRALEIEGLLRTTKDLKNYVAESLPQHLEKRKVIGETEKFFEIRNDFLKHGTLRSGYRLLRYLSFYPHYRSCLADLKAGLRA